MMRILCLLIAVAGLSAAVAPGHRAVVKDTDGSPYGFAEYVPDSYDDSTTSLHPLVIFLHGVGEQDAGTDATQVWNKATAHGPNKLIKNGSTRFATEGAIVVSPVSPVWWNASTINTFVDFLFTRYRIDPDRFYVTGLSMGGGGTWAYVSGYGDRVAATIPICGAAGAGNPTKFANVPVWAFHAWGDGTVTRNNSIGWCNRIAAFLDGQGTSAMTDLLAGYPHSGGNTSNAATETMTARFSTAWSWVSGSDASTAPRVKLTLYTDSSHDSWTRTYNNPEVWNWLFSFERGGGIPGNTDPTVSFLSPADQAVFASGATVTLSGSGNDAEDGTLTGTSLSWSSDLSGVLGTGTSLAVTPSVGIHRITLTATDSVGGRATTTRTIQVRRSSAYRIVADLGASALSTPGNINNLTSTTGSIATAIGDDGSATGVAVTVSDAFVGINQDGVDAADLYPATAQRDTFYVDSLGDARGELTFSNLDPDLAYDLVLFASRTASDLRETRYTVGSASAILNAAGNTATSVRLDDLRPDAEGRIVLVVEANGTSRYGYLGVFELIAHTPSGGGGGGSGGGGGGGSSGPSISAITITLHGTCDPDVTSIQLGATTVTPSGGSFSITASIPGSGLSADLIARTGDGRERRIPIDAATLTVGSL